MYKTPNDDGSLVQMYKTDVQNAKCSDVQNAKHNRTIKLNRTINRTRKRIGNSNEFKRKNFFASWRYFIFQF